MQNLPASVVREPVTDEQVQKIDSQIHEAWGETTFHEPK